MSPERRRTQLARAEEAMRLIGRDLDKARALGNLRVSGFLRERLERAGRERLRLRYPKKARA